MNSLGEILFHLIKGLVRPLFFIFSENYRSDFREELGDVPEWSVAFHILREWTYVVAVLSFIKLYLFLLGLSASA